MEIQFTTRVFKEGRTYVAHTTELPSPESERTASFTTISTINAR
jgi:hypothetical protein